ncbi:MAG: GNAT family N-acetyltransferase [Chloroflexota bacterium]|nr:GNAT family N-acetyltransferase [Chloroflexota bacterium]
MAELRIVDVTDEATFRLVPPCADPGFDHRSCDYWEDGERGSKAARLNWLEPGADRSAAAGAMPRNPFGEPDDVPLANPFVPQRTGAPAPNPFAAGGDRLADNPFAPPPTTRPTFGPDRPRKLGLLGRGLGVFGSYAKVLLIDEVAAAYAQFGPLSAYPRALRLRELYPQLPDAPLPAVITCIATTPAARGGGHARRLVEAVCADLAARGFAAVEAYPEAGARPDATSGATPAFWQTAGFSLAVADEHFPVVRRELG